MDVKNEVSDGIVKSKNLKIEKILECPFTWDFDDILQYEEDYQKKKIKNYGGEEEEEENSEVDYTSNYFSHLLMLMNKATSIYVMTSLKKQVELEKILRIIKIGDKFMNALKQRNDPEISLEVAKHIFLATQYYVYQKFNMIDEMSRVSALIDNINYDNKKDKSTLLGCKSLSRSRYNKVDLTKAEGLIREALKENPNCHLWYYTLATIIRRRRKDSGVSTIPGDEEIVSFNEAYKLSPNLMYEICIAQMYRELGYFQKAEETYKKLYNNLPNNSLIILRLALGFMQIKDFRRAKVCLNKLEERNYDNSIFYHYKALYYFKQYMYKDAVPYFKEAIKNVNITAEKDYLRCMIEINKNFPVVNHLLSLLKKYDTVSEDHIQIILIDLALCYWKKENNIDKALDYFLQGIKIKPDALCLTNYFDYLKNRVGRDIFFELKRNFFPTIEKRLFYNKNSDILLKANELKNFCVN